MRSSKPGRWAFRGALLAAVPALLWGACLHAQQTATPAIPPGQSARPGLDEFDRQWIERSRQILRDAQTQPPPSWLTGTPQPAGPSGAPTGQVAPQRGPAVSPRGPAAFRRDVPNWLAPGNGASPGPSAFAQPAVAAGEQRIIFVSRSMPEAELRAALEEAAQHGAAVVMRGVRRGENVAAFAAGLRTLAERIERVPEVQLDPFAFRRERVEVVPTVIVRRGDESLRASGSLALGDLVRRFERGERGDRGRIGPSYVIAEADMMQLIEERITQTDWRALKEQAYARFWSGQQLPVLPAARMDRERLFDPSVVVREDIRSADGRIVARAGQRFNPQAIMPLRSTWFVFDASDPRQVERVASELAKLGNTRTVLMTTRLEPGEEWAQLRRIEDRFGQPLSLATSQLLERFGIERLPARVSGRGSQLVIAELGVPFRTESR